VIGLIHLNEEVVQAVPVRGMLKLSTSIGTERLAPRLSILVSGIKSSGCFSRNERCCLVSMVLAGD
jgi:hypothetical protein